MSDDAAKPTVSVRALASSGAGVAELPDGRVVFVPRTAPGDTADVEVVKKRSSWATARLHTLRERGETRQEAPCPLYSVCGGCALQHMEYEAQLRWKGQWVADALERIGNVEVEVPDVVPSPRPFHYRNRVTFTLRRLRGGRVVGGFHHLERSGHVVDVDDECLLPEKPIVEVWTALRSAWGGGAHRLPDGGRLRLVLRNAADGVVLLVQGGDEGWRGGGLLEDVAGLAAVWHQPDPDTPAHRVAGEDVEEVWGPDRYRLRGDAFLQVNREAARAVYAHVLEEAGAGPGAAVDAYCGVGVYGRELARRGWRVTGVELAPSAAASAAEDAPDGFDLLRGKVEDHLPETLPADLVILNPPRAGLHDDVPPALLAAPPPRIVYVSCDPATLARDVKRLSVGYEVAGVVAFDLFPQTAHVETVAVLRARDASEPPGEAEA